MRAQAIFRAEGLPALRPIELRRYGCCRCQSYHTEPDPLFEQHLFHQSKHGWNPINRFRWVALAD